MVRVTEARYLRDYVLWIRFNDGVEGEVDLKGELNGPIFEPLQDLAEFRAFQLHPELHTVTWSNGADFAPEFLHELVKVPA